jgi:hypothetical protein
VCLFEGRSDENVKTVETSACSCRLDKSRCGVTGRYCVCGACETGLKSDRAILKLPALNYWVKYF